MKKTCLLITLSLFSFLCKAQYISTDSAKVKIIRQDTINIKGRVFDAEGRLVPYVFIISKNNKLVYQGYPLYAVSDKNGEFQLNGALPVDTLKVLYKNLNFNVINNKSRTIQITLPQILPATIDAGEISAKRKIQPKSPAQFKVITNATIMDYFGIPATTNARPVGSVEQYIHYIKSKLTYPQAAIDNNIEGEVKVQFTVDKAGNIIDPRIINSIGYGCDDVVINALKDGPKWRPAITMGRPVTDQYIIEIDFKLTDK